MKKILSITLVLLLMFSAVPLTSLTASAETLKDGDYEYRVLNDDTVEITKYNGLDELVEIPLSIEGKIVVGIGEDAFYSCKSIKNIVFPEKLLYIGDCAFVNCKKLEKIIIPNSVKSIETRAFKNCVNLKKIVLGDEITNLGYEAFFNTAFFNDKTNWEENVLYINEYLLTGKYREFDDELESYKNIDSVSGIYTVKDGTKLIANDAFEMCGNLLGLIMADSVEYMGRSAFEYCTSLKSIVFSNSLTEISQYAFFACNSLDNIYIPNSVRIIDKGAFSSCFELKKVFIPDSVDTIREDAFYSCISLKNIVIPKSVKIIGKEAFGFKWDEGTSKVDDFTIIGYIGFAGEAYAKANNFKFVSLDTPTVIDQNKTENNQNQSAAKKLTLKLPKVKLISGKKQFKVKYTKVKDAVGFKIRYKIKGKWITKTFNTKKSVTKVIKGLKKGKYKVQICAFSKGKKSYSKWTKVKTVKVK